MLNKKLKSVIFLIVVFFLSNCIDPYTLKLKEYDSLLVVDGLITDANTSYTVKLSRAFIDASSSPVTVSDASVFITDDVGNSSYLINMGDGKYKTDSIGFSGTTGRTYTLHILTHEGKEYKSDPCLMQSVPDIDSVYFEKDQELVNNSSESQEGVMIYLDSNTGDENQYLRWSFDETWKFKLPTPKKYDFIDSSRIVPIANPVIYCWKSRQSDDIITQESSAGENVHVKKQPIFFIATDKSDRITIKYSILVKQYSISKNEYDFWNDLKKITDGGGDIFAAQPFSVLSNIHNINNQKESVLGYFQVSAVKQKRIFITLNQIYKLDLPFYHYDTCKRIVDKPVGPGMTWAKLYAMYCIYQDYLFIEPEYDPDTGELEMVFARPECANCELTGTSKKPDFWIN